jgi:transcription antitermination factor NusG
MSGLQKHIYSMPTVPPIGLAPVESNWYAVHTMARHEKRIAQQFQEKQIHTFLPLLQQVHRWSDRQTKVEVPLFSCYAFVRIPPTEENRVKVLRTPGVLGFVGTKGQGTSIPDEEIETLLTAMREKIPFRAHPFIKNGERVRILGGCLEGVEGILEKQGEDQSLIVSVQLLQRFVSIRVNGYDIELI